MERKLDLINEEVAMKTYLFIPANLFMIFILAGCMIEDPLSEDFLRDDAYSDEETYEYVPPVLPKCEASMDFNWMVYSGPGRTYGYRSCNTKCKSRLLCL